MEDACRNGQLETVKWLHSVGCDPTAQNNDAICSAAEKGHLEVVKWLYEKGCQGKSGALSGIRQSEALSYDPTAQNNRTICYAAERGRLETVKWLLSIGCWHQKVKYKIVYDSLQENKCKMNTLLNGKGYDYLKLDVLHHYNFTDYQVMQML